MATISTTLGSGGNFIAPGQGGPNDDLLKVLQEIADDFATVKTQILALGTKLDADTGITDTDYNATLTTGLTGFPKTVKET